MKKKSAKKPIIIAAIGAGVAAIGVGLARAFRDLKKNAKEQHEVDVAEFEAAKAEARANFEENRGRNTFARAKESAKKVWNEAKQGPAKRAEAAERERAERIAAANARTEAANERYEAAKGE